MSKEKSKTTTKKVGDVAIQTTEFSGSNRKPRYQTVIRRQEIPQTYRRVSHASFEAAHKFASELDLALQQGKVRELFRDENIELRKISEELKVSRLIQKSDQASANKTPLWARYLEKETTLTDLFEAGKLALETAAEINTAREKAKLPPIKSGELFRRLKEVELAETVVRNRPKFSELIDERIKFKTGPNGGDGMVELEPSSKREWSEKLLNLKKYIGIFNTGHEPEDLIRLVTVEGINKEKKRRDPGKGKPWAARTRFKQATKIKEFGAWLVKIKKRTGWTENHFEELPNLYKIKHVPKHKTFSAKQISKLFEVAGGSEEFFEHIPFLALSCFAGLRPFEVGDPNDNKRRYDFANAEGWEVDSLVTGGKLIQVPAFDDDSGARRSKISYDRQADVSANGFAWIEWWAEQKEIDLPTEGLVHFSYNTFVKIRKAAGITRWIDDGLRHTAASMFHQNVAFKATTSYWMDSLGHDRAVYKKHYSDTKRPAEVKEYFEITPEKLFS